MWPSSGRAGEGGSGTRPAGAKAVGLDGDAEPGQSRRVEAAEAAARADDAPASPGAFERLQSDGPADARRWIEDQRERPLGFDESRIAADPDELFAPHQTAAILAGAALGEHEVEFTGIERLKQRAAQRHGQFEIDGKMNPGEFAQHLGQPALHKILRGAKANTPAQLPSRRSNAGRVRSRRECLGRAPASPRRPPSKRPNACRARIAAAPPLVPAGEHAG